MSKYIKKSDLIAMDKMDVKAAIRLCDVSVIEHVCDIGTKLFLQLMRDIHDTFDSDKLTARERIKKVKTIDLNFTFLF